MQVKNIKIFDSTVAADGAWIDVSNLVSISIQVNNIEGNVWIEVSNDPNVNFDGTGIGAPSAPTLVAVPATAMNANLVSQGTLSVKVTYITPWGETTASAATALAVPNNQVLMVKAPAALKTAIGYNVYVSQSGGAGTWVLQTMPQFKAQRVIDTGGIHWATAGAVPLTQNYFLINGFQNNQVVPPASDLSGDVNTGVKLQTTLVGATSSEEIAIFITGANCMVNPSNLTWKFLRVRKDTSAQTLETIAWLMGQNG